MKEGRRELSRKQTLIALKIVLPLNRKSNVSVYSHRKRIRNMIRNNSEYNQKQ